MPKASNPGISAEATVSVSMSSTWLRLMGARGIRASKYHRVKGTETKIGRFPSWCAPSDYLSSFWLSSSGLWVWIKLF